MQETPKLIPLAHRDALTAAIAEGNTDRVKNLVEQHNLNVDAFLDDLFWEPVLMKALLSHGFESEPVRLPLLRYLLEHGANPSIICRRGYNCLHIAAQQEKLVQALELFLDFKADVNATDSNGANTIYWLLQKFPWRTTGEVRVQHLQVIRKALLLGANLDQSNRYGVNARKWLERAPQDVRDLVAGWEESKPVSTPVNTLKPKFTSNLQYPELANKIWKDFVPPVGPADTVQGELLRAIEKLRDEAQRNGNVNYQKSHKRMAGFVRDTLIKSGIFDEKAIESIKSATAHLMKATRPYVEDDLYDYIVDQVCIFYTRAETLIPYKAPTE